MFKALPLLIIVGLVAGCASSPEPASDKAPDQPQVGCYQSEWQAETVPVINKRSGPEGLEKYEPEQQQQAHGCP